MARPDIPPAPRRCERPGFVTDAEPFGIFGLEALIDRMVWRAERGSAAC